MNQLGKVDTEKHTLLKAKLRVIVMPRVHVNQFGKVDTEMYLTKGPTRSKCDGEGLY